MYLSPEDIRQDTHLKRSDLGFATDEELDAWIDVRLLEMDDLAQTWLGAEWNDGTVPLGVKTGVREMMRNLISNTIATRDGSVVSMGEYRVRVIESNILTQAVKDILEPYRGYGVVVETAIPAPLPFRMFRVRRPEELTEEELDRMGIDG